MEIKLTIDRGNTAIKGALWTPDGTILAADKGDESTSAGELAAALMHRTGVGKIAGAVYCSVVAGDRTDDLESLRPLSDRLTELTASARLPITIAYRTPATLGADRIAAALGAVALAGDSRPLLVSDIGTAVTYDFVKRGPVYCGGNIAPGMHMRLRALAAFTDALPAVDPETGDVPMWGETTAEAMRSGAVRGIVAELEYYHKAAGPGALAVLSGGSAKFLADSGLLTFDYIHDPYLVHRGLYSIIKDEN